jgi:uncharacterized protein (DUF952 family)
VEHRTAEESRDAGVTYHLVPSPVWVERGKAETYVPEAYDADGFIHCTNGLEPLLAVANMFYIGDERQYLVLVLEVSRIRSDVRYDDEHRVYPHIYGPLNTDAVIGELLVERAQDGTFTGYSHGPA